MSSSLNIQLYQTAKRARRRVRWLPFPSDRGYGHRQIHSAPELMDAFRYYFTAACLLNSSHRKLHSNIGLVDESR